MASDYEAHGSISNTQLAPQRKSSDTYFGELVLKTQHTGDSVGDNIRSEIVSLGVGILSGFPTSN